MELREHHSAAGNSLPHQLTQEKEHRVGLTLCVCCCCFVSGTDCLRLCRGSSWDARGWRRDGHAAAHARARLAAGRLCGHGSFHDAFYVIFYNTAIYPKRHARLGAKYRSARHWCGRRCSRKLRDRSHGQLLQPQVSNHLACCRHHGYLFFLNGTRQSAYPQSHRIDKVCLPCHDCLNLAFLVAWCGFAVVTPSNASHIPDTFQGYTTLADLRLHGAGSFHGPCNDINEAYNVSSPKPGRFNATRVLNPYVDAELFQTTPVWQVSTYSTSIETAQAHFFHLHVR